MKATSMRTALLLALVLGGPSGQAAHPVTAPAAASPSRSSWRLTVPPEALVDTAQETLRSWLRTWSEAPSVRVAQAPSPVTVERGRLALRPMQIGPASALAPRMTVWIEVLRDGQIARRVPVVFEVSAPTQVWRLARSAVPWQSLDEGWLERVTVDAAAERRPFWSGDPATVRLRHPMPAGRVLTLADVEPRVAVSRGARVMLKLRREGLEIGTEARALHDAQVGEVVRVRPLRAADDVLGRVVGPNVVGVIDD